MAFRILSALQLGLAERIGHPVPPPLLAALLYISDAPRRQEDVDNIRTALKNAKGPGNFPPDLLLYSPNGRKLQVVQVGEVAARGELLQHKKRGVATC